MPDREKVIKDLAAYRDRDFIREGINVFDSDPRYRKMIINNALALLKEDCHNCKLECLLQKYDELKEKYDALLEENASNAEMAEGLKDLLKEQQTKIDSAKEIAIDERTNATWRDDYEAWKVVDRIAEILC